ncbi:MAG: MATE family efflux transporter, partial [Eubacterium sp.]
MDQSFMKTRKILPLVISMSLPMVVSMIVNSLYNIVDSFFVAKISEDAMTALSLVFPIQNLMAAVSIGFGVGANAVTAYFLGAQDRKQADGAASLSLLLSLLHAAILTV